MVVKFWKRIFIENREEFRIFFLWRGVLISYYKYLILLEGNNM